MREGVIQEDSAETELSPDLPRQSLKKQESFKTNAFESIDSFVQLENQLLQQDAVEYQTKILEVADEDDEEVEDEAYEGAVMS